MRGIFTLICAVGVAALVHVPAGARQTPPRDAAPKPLQGTAVLGGVITTDDVLHKPVRGAIVTINHADKLYGDTAITDDRGRFVFSRIPAGRYLLAADKDGFIRLRYGAARPGRAGTPIALTEGQRLEDLALRLVRGGVVTGRVLGAGNEPAEGTPMTVMQYVTIGGQRRLVNAHAGGQGRTDDEGIYRFWGLPAGEYIVQAAVSFGFHDSGGSVRRTTAADVAWAKLQLLASGAGDRRAETIPPAGATYGFASVYYPNVLQRSAATIVTLAPGEERTGIDINLQLVPTCRIEGVVVGADGRAAAKATSVYLVETGENASGMNGIREGVGPRFAFDGVAPGPYALAAMVDETKEWSMIDLNVGGQNMSPTLTLQPPLAVSGSISFQGTSPVPADLTRVRVHAAVVGAPGGFSIEPESAAVRADGTFTVRGLMAGAYRFGASLAGGPGSAWTMRSAMVGRQDVADLPLEVPAGSSIGNIAVSFTDRPTELSGQLQDPSGRAAADYFIIVFPVDARLWFTGSRRIAQTRPGNDGRFVIRGLPPGEYQVAALTDVERDEWYDAGFLKQLVSATMKLSLAEGEKKVVDFMIK